MEENEQTAKTTKPGLDKNAIIIAIIGAITSIAVAYIAGGSAGAQAGSARAAALGPVPKGTVAFFNAPNCPDEWRVRSDAQGRYLVGLSANFQGSLNQVVGTPLGDKENRATGAHTHSDNTISSIKNARDYVLARGKGPDGLEFKASITKTGGANDSTGTSTPAGTNAPYLQLLVCEKS